MTTRPQQLTDNSLAELGISIGRGPIAMPCPAPEGNRTNSTDKTYMTNGERVADLVCGQVGELQRWLDASFAVSTTVSFNCDKLAEEFGVPVREILRAVRMAWRAGRLPSGMQIFGDHRMVITLGATVRQ